MTNQASIQTKIWRGYAKAAEKLGSAYAFTRPAATYPGDALFNRLVSLNAEDMKYGRPNKYGKATWYALVDGTEHPLGPGDCLVIAPGAMFSFRIGEDEPFRALACMRSGGRATLDGETFAPPWTV